MATKKTNTKIKERTSPDTEIIENKKSNSDDIDKLFEKEFENLKVQTAEDAEVKYWLTTGIYSLNWLFSNDLRKGIPGQRVTGFSGLTGTAKSVLVMSIAANNPSIDKIIAYDSEKGLAGELIKFVFKSKDPKRQKYLDEQLKKLRIIPVNTMDCYQFNDKGNIESLRDDKFNPKNENHVEGLTSILMRMLNAIERNKKKSNILLILDSIGNMTDVKELTGAADMGHRSMLLGKMFRDLDNRLERVNATFVYTNQLYTNVGAMGWEDKFKEPGGTKVEHNPSLRIRIVPASATDEHSTKEKDLAKKKKALGKLKIKLNVEVQKSRYGTAGRKTSFVIDFREGIDRFAGLFDLMKDLELLKHKNSGVYELEEFGGCFDKSGFRKNDFSSKIVDFGEEEFLNILQEKLDNVVKTTYFEIE